MKKSSLTALIASTAMMLGGCNGYSGRRAQTNTLSFASENVTLRTPSVATDYINIDNRQYFGLRASPGKTASQITTPQVMMGAKLIPGDNYNETTSSKTNKHVAAPNDETYFLPNAYMDKVDGKDTLVVNKGVPLRPLRILISQKSLERKVVPHGTPLTFTEIAESGIYRIQKVPIRDDEGMTVETVYAIPMDASQVPGSKNMAFVRVTDGLPEVITDTTHRLVSGKPVTETRVYIRDITYIPFKDVEVPIDNAKFNNLLVDQMPLAIPTPEPVKKD